MILSAAKSKIAGEVNIPGSKSHTIRALAIATLAKGSSIIKAPLVSDDTVSSLAAASALGAWIKRGDDSIWKISGTGGKLMEPAGVLDLGDSGTGVKLFAALASLADFPVVFDGDASLRSRPMSPLLSALSMLGVEVSSQDGKCPFRITGPMRGGETDVEGKSSQYLSALLLAAPLAAQDTVMNVQNLNEIPYVDITLDWLERQGIALKHDSSYSRFQVTGNQTYKPFNVKIPGDFSTAAFPLVAGAVTGGEVRIDNLNFEDKQGDKAVFDYLKAMGADLEIGADYAVIHAGCKLHSIEQDMNATPDLLPIMCVAAACAEGISVFKNVAQARIKETDRIAVMSEELEKLGIQTVQFDDGIAVTGGRIHGGHVQSHADHRIAMSLAIAGMTLKDAKESVIIDEAECIAVTYPGFFDDFRNMGAVFYEI